MNTPYPVSKNCSVTIRYGLTDMTSILFRKHFFHYLEILFPGTTGLRQSTAEFNGPAANMIRETVDHGNCLPGTGERFLYPFCSVSGEASENRLFKSEIKP